MLGLAKKPFLSKLRSIIFRGYEMQTDYLEEFELDGYAVFRQVFKPQEMTEIHAATERVRQRALAGQKSCGNAKFYISDGYVRSATWCAMYEPILAEVRSDQRLLTIIEPLIGNNVRQLINNLHWKTPGSTHSVAFHADRINRINGQAQAIRNLPQSYIQTGLAVAPMQADNGPLIVIRGSHKQIDKEPIPTSVYSDDVVMKDELFDLGYHEEDIIELHLEPGDLAIWGPDTLHGSAANQNSELDRCFHINGYVNAYDCFMGYWAWIIGASISLPPKEVPEHVFGKQNFEMFEAK